jgi:hypothetical protein
MKYNKHKGGGKKIQRGGALPDSNSNSTLLITNASATDGKLSEFIPVKRLPYDIQIFSLLCIIGVLVQMFFGQAPKFFGQPSNDYATATVYGYGFCLLSLLGLLMSSFAISTRDSTSQGFSGFINVVLKNAMPLIVTVIVVALILTLNIIYYAQLNSGSVADEYYQFSNISSFFMLVQFVIIIKYLIDLLLGQQKKDEGKSSGVMNDLAGELSSFIWVLSIINISIVGILYVILKYFSTDG